MADLPIARTGGGQAERQGCVQRRGSGPWHVARRGGCPVILALVLLAILCGGNGTCRADEPAFRWEVAKELQAGIRLARVDATSPRPMRILAIRADTLTPGIRFVTTPRCQGWVEGESETVRQTARSFLRSNRIPQRTSSTTAQRRRAIRLVVAVNGDAFTPWPAPFQEETVTNLMGLAVCDGELVSRGSGTPSLIVRKNGRVDIAVTAADADIRDVETAVSGFEMCLVAGQIPSLSEELNPRTGLGLSRDGRYLIAVTIDGRQPSSLGGTKGELGTWLRHFGAHDGINMDGGGSTTIAFWDVTLPGEDKSRVLNQPVGDGRRFAPESLPDAFQPTERANGNHLGIGFQEP